MTLKEEVNIVCSYIILFWIITWLGGGLLVYGTPTWWSPEAAAEALSRMVILWVMIGCFMVPWTLARRLLKIRELPFLVFLPILPAPTLSLLETMSDYRYTNDVSSQD